MVHVTISGVSACENYRGISVAAGRALSLSSLKVAPGDFGVMQANLTCVSLTPLCSGRVENQPRYQDRPVYFLL